MKYVLSIIILSFSGFVLLNGYYALRWPMQFLGARWTIRRGLSSDTSRGELRTLGVIFMAGGVVLMWMGLRVVTPNVAFGISQGKMVGYSTFALLWIFDALWLTCGMFALIAPKRWVRSRQLGGRWHFIRIPALAAHPILVRLFGIAMICVSMYFASVGIRMAHDIFGVT